MIFCICSTNTAKTLRKVDPDIAARSAWASIHGVTSLLITYPDFPWGDREAVIAGVLDALIDGLRRR